MPRSDVALRSELAVDVLRLAGCGSTGEARCAVEGVPLRLYEREAVDATVRKVVESLAS